MKKLSIILIFCYIITSSLFSNPIIPPAKIAISEIYFTSDGWVMEVVAEKYIGAGNLDSVVMETSAGKSYFKSGINITDEQVFIITSDSLKTPLAINPLGDFIHLMEIQDGYTIWDTDWFGNIKYGGTIKFGNYAESTISAPFLGQSLSVVRGQALAFSPLGDPIIYEPLMLTKMNVPTLGSFPFTNNETDTIKGYVIDKNNNPIYNVKLSYFDYYSDYIAFGLHQLNTNSDGYFETKLYATNYPDVKIIINDSVYKQINLKVELDSANFYKIKVENYFVSGLPKIATISPNYNVTIYPNPVKNFTTFKISIPSGVLYKKALIKIYNKTGQIVDIFPLLVDNQKSISFKWYIKENLPNGEYIYSLEIDNKRITSDKIIIFR